MRAEGHDRINVQNNPVNLIDPFGLWSLWAGGSNMAAFGPWGYNQGGGIAYDSGSNGGLGIYSSEGKSQGFAFSGGSEIGFFTGSISGYSNNVTYSAFGFSVGFLANFEGDYGIVLGYALGAPFEGNISDNNTSFFRYSDLYKEYFSYYKALFDYLKDSLDEKPCP